MAGGDYNHLRGCCPDGSAGKEPICNAKDTGDTGSILRSRGAPKGGNGNSTPVFLPKNSHKYKSMVGYSPKGRKESDMTEQLSTRTEDVDLADPYTLAAWINSPA